MLATLRQLIFTNNVGVAEPVTAILSSNFYTTLRALYNWQLLKVPAVNICAESPPEILVDINVDRCSIYLSKLSWATKTPLVSSFSGLDISVNASKLSSVTYDSSTINANTWKNKKLQNCWRS